MFELGQKVYIVPEDSRNKPYEATIVSIGRKYICVKEFDGQPIPERFNIYNRHSALVNNRDPRKDIYESREDYEQQMKINAERNELIRFIKNNIHKSSLHKLRTIKDIVNNELN